MYKLVAIDMDGTLLRSDKSISDRTKSVIKKAREKGVTVVLATGRPIEGVRKTLEELEMLTDKDYVLSYNGALVQKTKSKEAISKVTINGKDLHYLYGLSKELNVNIHAFVENKGLVTPKNSKYTQVEADINNIDIKIDSFDNIKDEDIVVKVMFIDEPEILGPAYEKLPKEVFEKYTVVMSTPFFLEFLNKNVNKGLGLQLLAKHLGIKRKEIIAIGDAENDRHMIEYAGLGIAMGNAFESIKEIADYITDSNDEDGVAKAIEKFVL
ncbi:sugar-phosphatase [Caproiciproducens sp. MSJ-32]|uniref:sugar-phosphatase n=1 Tax=Caproiciproducens sp. MSJ-32 TaxID=2841527 RepID=UPI001C10EACC|nr:sugar-phosphatase [Caproiciproducens sp. MSJ-32]MBU5453995.1 sugar-phosphatase [Caproiciproducens sp. MSJ-32]